ncbi:hypothetical protein F3N42_07475 [Marinihelvus fidelis]|uniref:Nuclear transport factor 2 family protein n=2 Tax=Marinihelvus fidelis TaxID=2613842 RepID=A0A5N0TAK9_9GAMM|nr:hypothetical protein F3N42_07475 [Marinihelvus fidelis]
MSCSSDSVEDQVRATIDAMETAAEEGAPIAFMGHVAEDFEGRNGQMQRQDFMRFMTLQINRHSRIRAQLFPITVTDDGGNFATATFKVLVTGGGSLIPEEGQVYDVETTWIREGGDWLLWRADWRVVIR